MQFLISQSSKSSTHKINNYAIELFYKCDDVIWFNTSGILTHRLFTPKTQEKKLIHFCSAYSLNNNSTVVIILIEEKKLLAYSRIDVVVIRNIMYHGHVMDKMIREVDFSFEFILLIHRIVLIGIREMWSASGDHFGENRSDFFRNIQLFTTDEVHLLGAKLSCWRFYLWLIFNQHFSVPKILKETKYESNPKYSVSNTQTFKKSRSSNQSKHINFGVNETGFFWIVWIFLPIVD